MCDDLLPLGFTLGLVLAAERKLVGKRVADCVGVGHAGVVQKAGNEALHGYSHAGVVVSEQAPHVGFGAIAL